MILTYQDLATKVEKLLGKKLNNKMHDILFVQFLRAVLGLDPIDMLTVRNPQVNR